jgi:hypothetical protein
LFKLTLIPREKKFFALFEQGSQNALKIAQQLKEMVYVWENLKQRVSVVNDLEHQGDAITHQIFEQLHRSVITPFDREDIALLAHSLDDVVDFIHAAADAMLLHLGVPVSTTHVITGAISGVGSANRFTAVRWGVTVRIVWPWIFTIPSAALLAGLIHSLLRMISLK